MRKRPKKKIQQIIKHTIFLVQKKKIIDPVTFGFVCCIVFKLYGIWFCVKGKNKTENVRL